MKMKKIILGVPQEFPRPEEFPKEGHRFLWWSCLYLTMTAGGILALAHVWREATLRVPILLCYDVVLMALAWMTRTRQRKWRMLAGVLPWIALLVLFTVGNPIEGGASWINSLLLRWNERHKAMARAISVEATPLDQTAFAVLLLTCASQCAAGLLRRKRLGLGLVYFGVFLLLSLESMPDRGLSTALLLTALLGYFLSGPTVDTSGRAAVVWCLTGAVLLAGGLLPAKPIQAVTNFREGTQRWIRLVRYGEEQLPLGDLSRAEALKKNSQTALSVHVSQEKDLYLKAFTGADYSDGRWEALPNTAYGGDNTGLFTWLKKQNFQPQTQLAQYYSLCDMPFPENTVQVQVRRENRYRLYVPASLEGLGKGTARFRYDEDLTAKGLFGKNSYQYTEVSGTRPGELSLLEGWVASPVTQQQQQYAQAEAVYREFVYQNYTQVDSGLSGLMRSVFHREELESDSVFSVLTHIRDVLRQRCRVTSGGEAPEGEDPIGYFLTVGHEGNAMLFASTAVEALRSYGIPARYAEGYYCAASQIGSARGDEILLTGKAAHAWVEVYFDGMGWVNVDVTPGYYYDLVALQNLVNLPEDVTKTADLSKNDDQAGELPGDKEGGQGEALPDRRSVWNPLWLAILLSIAATLAVVLLVTMELCRACAELLLRRRFQRADPLLRAKIMEKLLFKLLASWGIQAGLGWKSQELDALLPDTFPLVEKGEYLRVCALLEKAVYGEIPPEIYEERTMVSFLKKLSKVKPGIRLHRRFLARYQWIALV